ncbi:hypothetical protein POM88_047981 [Heracleum sosnowskyi]|uniref:Dipeptidylpeptidase IV N-terminal domain-containing protein n=1 Tax=Heracleum sosnowskyi TaxID=360622 RepID=A0AAD8GT13_9APIA|nr:hypothetical protein POM88_047981 [Heracleum sosnowskyi]
MGEERGSIAFFTTYRPPVALDIFSTLFPRFENEIQMTDGVSYNYNGHSIPPATLKTLLKRPVLVKQEIKEDDVDLGRVSAMIFVSERESLETFHVVLDFKDGKKPEVFSLAEIYSRPDCVRMEDSAYIAGEDREYLVYVSTKDPANRRRQPWTVVYRTNLITGTTDRLTPSLQADLSPSVSPCGKKIAVASFQKKAGWNGEIVDLQTDIFVMNVEKPYNRHLVVDNGGWPKWGSDNIIVFHRKVGQFWGVFRADIENGLTPICTRVTPDTVDAMTPAAIDANTVAVAIDRPYSSFGVDVPHEKAKYRHIEIHDSTNTKAPIQITERRRPTIDHFNPFVVTDGGKKHIGYHRTNLVFRSTRDFGKDEGYKNLYIMENLAEGDYGEGKITRLTEGDYVDTHCQWSPSGNWIVFSSTRDKPTTAAKKDHMLDAGYFAIFLVNPDHKDVVVRVLGSADDLAGHVNNPFFSPDGKSIVITADLAAVSVDPISLPLIEHSARPYGDIFTIDIHPNDIQKNENVKKFNRMTHTRYENSTDDRAWATSGHPCLPKRCP